MSDFLNNLTSISWWIGVVIVGILLNLAANYLKSPTDKLVSSISTKYQTRSKAKKAEREAKIKELVGNKYEQILFAAGAIHTLVSSVFWHLTALFFVTFGSMLTIWRNLDPVAKNKLDINIMRSAVFIFGIYSLLYGNSKFTKANDDRKILEEAKDRESKVESKSN